MWLFRGSSSITCRTIFMIRWKLYGKKDWCITDSYSFDVDENLNLWRSRFAQIPAAVAVAVAVAAAAAMD